MKSRFFHSAILALTPLIVAAVFMGCHYPKHYAKCQTAEDYLLFALDHPNSALSADAAVAWATMIYQEQREMEDFWWGYVTEVDSAYAYRGFAEEYADYPGVEIASLRAQTLEEDSLLLSLYESPSIQGFQAFKTEYPLSAHTRAVNSCIDDLVFWFTGESSAAFWQQYLQAYPNGLMADRARTGVYNLEIESLLAKAEPSEMVTSEPEIVDWLPEVFSGLTIRNTCSSDLTVFYQGIDETLKWVVAPNDSVVDIISPNTYRIIASVEEDDVQNYEGKITLHGGDWKNSLFYIQRGKLGL